ncbi:hypothetical protein IOD16_03515 [Saccharothrix sp. 6-C]|uniref:hypothetical protein n=1 Tax=Saccharothrix sp. 6-C TaxID=2781735 RepID=UPI00191711D0|nr:hypothetical protein [Saccharothrix sp. 6-C]QQQ77599.1 hypothetical protein IOD16_03515 [Saccharothrix sp. 6-C]
MAARGEAQADVEVSTLVVPAWRLRWRAPELALVLGERAVALASARRDEVDRLRAEALVVFASNRMGRGVRIADRALDALKAAEAASERETAWRLRVELADSARSVGAPLTGFAAVRPVLEADDVPPGLRATALVQAGECLVSVGRGAALTQALDEADRLYQADPMLDHDTTLLHRGLLRASAAGQHRRWGDLQAAVAAARDGLAVLDRLKEPESDNGQVRGRLTVELVCALMDLNKPGEASEVGTPLLERPVRAPSASTAGWLRLALATRVHLPAGRVDQARDLLRDAADSAERHQLDILLAESLLALAHVHEVAGDLTEALANLRSAHAAERRRARAVYAVRARLAAEFSGVHRRQAGGLHDELAALLRTGTPVVAPPVDPDLAPEAKQQLRQWRPVQMHRNEGVRVKRSRRAAEDMTVEGLSAARAHAADRWRLVQPFGETEGDDPQPGGRRRAPDPETPPSPTQGRPEHARSGQAKPTTTPPAGIPTPAQPVAPTGTGIGNAFGAKPPTAAGRAGTDAPATGGTDHGTPTSAWPATDAVLADPTVTPPTSGPGDAPADLHANSADPGQTTPAGPAGPHSAGLGTAAQTSAAQTSAAQTSAAQTSAAQTSAAQTSAAQTSAAQTSAAPTSVGISAHDAATNATAPAQTPTTPPAPSRASAAQPSEPVVGGAAPGDTTPPAPLAGPGAPGTSGVVPGGNLPDPSRAGGTGQAEAKPDGPATGGAPSGAGVGGPGFGGPGFGGPGLGGPGLGRAGLGNAGPTSAGLGNPGLGGAPAGAPAGEVKPGGFGLGVGGAAEASPEARPGARQGVGEPAVRRPIGGAGLGGGGFGIVQPEVDDSGAGEPEAGEPGAVEPGAVESGGVEGGVVGSGEEVESGAEPPAPLLPGHEGGERSVPAAGLIAAAGAVRSGRRRAAREAADDEGERSSGDTDPSVLDTLKAAGLLDPQRAGGRRRAPDADEEAVVSEPEPTRQAEPEQVQWRVEPPPRLRGEAPPIDMFDSPTMVQPAVRDDVPPVGLGAAFVKGPLIPTARVPDPPDYPLPPVPDFAMSSPMPMPTSEQAVETEDLPPLFPPTDVDSSAENLSTPTTRPVPQSAPPAAPQPEPQPAPRPEAEQVPTVPVPDQAPPVPVPDPVSSDLPPDTPPPPLPSPAARFSPTGFLGAGDIEHDDTPAPGDPVVDTAGDAPTEAPGVDAAPAEDAPKEPFVTAVVVGGKTIDLPAIVVDPTPPAPDSPSATRASRRHKSDLSLAELLAEALVAYEDARREDEAAGRVEGDDESTMLISPVGTAPPESDNETTAPIQRVDPSYRFDTWTLPES